MTNTCKQLVKPTKETREQKIVNRHELLNKTYNHPKKVD